MEEPVYHLKGVLHGSQESLEDFSGPLDLILQLLSKKKMAIQDIRISDILEQYLAWMEEMKRLDLEIASEFVAMASYLLYIKSRMLVSATDPEAVGEMELLIRTLEERQRKEANARVQLGAKWLSERDGSGYLMFEKPAMPLPTRRRYDVRHDPADLLRAFDEILERTARNLPLTAGAFAGIAETEPYPVTLKSAQLLGRLVQTRTADLAAILADCGSRSELVATFLAVLELCRMNSISFDVDENERVEIIFLKMPEGELA